MINYNFKLSPIFTQNISNFTHASHSRFRRYITGIYTVFYPDFIFENRLSLLSWAISLTSETVYLLLMGRMIRTLPVK